MPVVQKKLHLRYQTQRCERSLMLHTDDRTSIASPHHGLAHQHPLTTLNRSYSWQCGYGSSPEPNAVATMLDHIFVDSWHTCSTRLPEKPELCLESLCVFTGEAIKQSPQKVWAWCHYPDVKLILWVKFPGKSCYSLNLAFFVALQLNVFFCLFFLQSVFPFFFSLLHAMLYTKKNFYMHMAWLYDTALGVIGCI